MQMDMTVKFGLFGLDFEADITYWSGLAFGYFSSIEGYKEPTPATIDFHSLYCGRGRGRSDVKVLLDSNELFEKFESAAGIVAEAQLYGDPTNDRK